MTETAYQHTYNLQQVAAKIVHQCGSKVVKSTSYYAQYLQQAFSNAVEGRSTNTNASSIIDWTTAQLSILSSIKNTALKLQIWPTGSLYINIGLFIVLIVLVQYLLIKRGFMSVYDNASREGAGDDHGGSKKVQKNDLEQGWEKAKLSAPRLTASAMTRPLRPLFNVGPLS